MTVQSLLILSADNTLEAFRGTDLPGHLLKRPTAIFVASGMGQIEPMSPQGSELGYGTICREGHAGHGHLSATVSGWAKALALLKNKGGLGPTVSHLRRLQSTWLPKASISAAQSRTHNMNAGTTVSSFDSCNEVSVGSGVSNEMPRVPFCPSQATGPRGSYLS